MTGDLPAVTKHVREDGAVEYSVLSAPDWDDFDSLAGFLQKYWSAEVTESEDKIYSRRWVLRSSGVPISLYHDSQLGNYFLREDGNPDQSLLERIEADLMKRLGGVPAGSTEKSSSPTRP